MDLPNSTSQPSTREDGVSTSLDQFTDGTSETKDASSQEKWDVYSNLPANRTHSTRPSPTAAMAPSRSSTLSWQRRPQSQGPGTPRSRPLSMIAAENVASRSPDLSAGRADSAEIEVSRSQIAQSLGSKDPSWFKQTAERGTGSAAYRRNQDENDSASALSNRKMQLPGMVSDSTRDLVAEKSPPPESIRSSSPSRDSSIRGSAGWAKTISSSSSLSGVGGLEGRSPLPFTSSQRFEPPSPETTSTGDGTNQDDLLVGRTLAMSPAQGRISPERLDRPHSPTKGLGGFVQSAMMKRSDSVNKRWSAQPGVGLRRNDSVTSVGNAFDSSMSSRNPSRETSTPKTLSRDHSPLPNRRPSSSYSNATLIQNTKENDIPLEQQKTATRENREASQQDGGDSNLLASVTSPPLSPSKPIDGKRWSPTKSSWLESALNKGPESPKPKTHTPKQPSWMADINKAKQQREGSVDRVQGVSSKEIKTGGLMRAPPPGGPIKPSSIGGLPSGFSSGIVSKGRSDSVASQGISGNHKAASTQAKASESPVAPSTPARNLTSPSISPENKPEAGIKSRSPPVATKSPSVATKMSPATAKSKPDTPPKKDFRSNLKPRQTAGGNTGSEEPEFKNVFGRLRQTKTQNYVAPDELKNNILRGKAGLNNTGGPKKTERKDEFKESILKQKENMKAKATGEDLPTAPKKESAFSVPKKSEMVPEPIAKLRSLPNSGIETNMKTLGGGNGSVATPLRREPELEARQGFNPDVRPSDKSSVLPKENGPGAKLAGRYNPALANLLARGPPSATTPKDTDRSVDSVTPAKDSLSSSQAEDVASGAPLVHMTKGRAKGPKRRAPAKNDSKPRPPPSIVDMDAPAKLLHTAEVPRPDSSVIPEKVSQESNAEELHSKKTNSSTTAGTESVIPKSMVSPVPEAPKKPQKGPVRGLNALLNALDAPKPVPKARVDKPITGNLPEKPRSSNDTLPTSTFSPKQPSAAPRPSPEIDRSTLNTLPKTSLSGPRPQPITKKPTNSPLHAADSLKPEVYKKSPTPSAPKAEVPPAEEEPLVSVKDAAADWVHKSSEPTESTRSRSPIKLPTRRDEELAHQNAGLRDSAVSSMEVPIGLGVQNLPGRPKSPMLLNKELPSPPMLSTNIPPPRAGLSPKSAQKASPLTLSPGSRKELSPKPLPDSPFPKATEASLLLANFFGDHSDIEHTKDIDTAAILSSRPGEPEKIKTLRKQIWQVSGDGKREPVPANQEHILFEDHMYLCTHIFGAANGTRTTEVYLWAGDGVTEAAVEDAQIFCKKVAKEFNGRFISFKQGKETSNFFQALGGIVITRRGSSNKANVQSSYMLCGRRYVGQIAFDEVDLSPNNFCSGFPYIVSSKTGKLYLWKGKGSGADELGCARLIGMDLGLSPDIDEVDEGHEPSGFFDVFGPGYPRSISKSADHWRLKASYDNYAVRLFFIGHNARSKVSYFATTLRSVAAALGSPAPQVTEISPFCQTDLEKTGIYVVDAFFEIYM